MILHNFVVFEGIDGTGTTTQIQLLQKKFDEKSKHRSQAVSTFEPTKGEIGQLIRKSLSGNPSFEPETMARLFSADRNEHVYGSGGIIELLNQGKVVICDRYLFSSLAYQSTAGDKQLTTELNARFPLPEYLFYFKIDADSAMDRVEKRSQSLEIYEKREFQREVLNMYTAILEDFSKKEPEMNIIYIDATENIDTIFEKIWSIVSILPKIK